LLKTLCLFGTGFFNFLWIMKFSDLLKERVVVFDGAMGSNLQSLDLSIDDWGGPEFENCSENLLYTRPDAIEKVHSSFLDVGLRRDRNEQLWRQRGRACGVRYCEKTYDVNKLAAELAKRLRTIIRRPTSRDSWPVRSARGRKLPTLGHITYRDLKDAYANRCAG
jgi:5-methyltetrahydrofolate--homocysteine methyltransferase